MAVDSLARGLALKAQATADAAGGGIPSTRSIATTAPLAGGGDLSADRTLSIAAATAAVPGSMSAADKAKLDAITGTNTGDNMLAQSAVASSVTGTLTETVLATITLPAGAMGANGQVEIEALFSQTNNANAKTLKFKFGASVVASIAGASTANSQIRKRVANRGSAAQQVSTSPAVATEWGISGVGIATYTENTANAVSITITGTLANTGDTITLESYRVLLSPKA